MSDQSASRFTPQNKSAQERLSTHTVGLVALSDFRKRRAEVLEQQERESREAAQQATGSSTPGTTSAPDSDSAAASDGAQPVTKKVRKKKKKKPGKKLLSFDDEEDDEEDGSQDKDHAEDASAGEKKRQAKIKANAAAGIVPKAMTTYALRKEAAEREALRREFLAIQAAVKATEIAIPFVFYDGANIPGGTVRVKKGDFVWVFLDKSRKVGAELGVGENANAVRMWARVGVDDLMLVRGTLIIPHHYEFYYFLVNKTLGPGGHRVFSYSAEAPANSTTVTTVPDEGPKTAASRAAALKALPDINTLEGARDDPTLTKVVDRRWYKKNKHIYPASTWQEFDPEKDYAAEIRRDGGGNAFFFSR
ncbi:hypothetical protein ACRE_040450 [Hapsidospora chrysogenum ATCC 11550]|uniref:FAM50A/XAP5 C-terminal domain-containing protein n=1 Tax=Hapsidospora chrysogenum (strain ATCC 11550 / CBS 779.69 / DSM 880 / IAM 14645 / JCM 23072 / IMI 49137) TaxID=857340 RepID=A0A086T767_HAPC1|nr:hypothetical protein ACRE_040450 [Hapsidospora chrysogenum ATCC 11550]